MDLYHFHRVLIASATLFCLGFSLYSYRQFNQLERAGYLVMAVGSVVIGLGMIGYLIYFNSKLAKIRHKST